MSRTKLLRDASSVLLLAVILLFTTPSLVRYWRVASTGPETSDATAQLDARMQPLRTALRGNDDPIGFVTDRNQIEHFYRTQYALAPWMLIPAEPVTGLELPPAPIPVDRYVGVFESPAALANAEIRLGLVRQLELADGLVVLTRKP